MSDQSDQTDDDEGDNGTAVEVAPDPQEGQDVTYYWLPADSVLAREVDYSPQVYRPSQGDWVYYDMNLAIEGQEISEADAQRLMSGEFAGDGGDPAADAEPDTTNDAEATPPAS